MKIDKMDKMMFIFNFIYSEMVKIFRNEPSKRLLWVLLFFSNNNKWVLEANQA